ncbi:MAG: hydroxymethylglutaryl-CoA lyase [Betaproteobacteria bacterium HGW-Betaproteobacteria-13]|jgi:hydroxymethylglutaryl-CoA lyase|nr:MAG: hydroxymethylglutaryl-CoA lyase [Betaproteobacteria bacterium HGW-Betaproteobacteria-13]
MLFEHAPRRVNLNEVSVRDGFQSEAVFVPTEDKIRLIDALSATGLARIEVTSFVSPKAIPNLRDAAEVMQGITRVLGVIYTALVPNEKGAERALACAADEINLVMSVGERHNLANMRMRCDQSLAQFRNIMKLVAAAPVRVNGTIATAFGCPFDGEQPLDRVLWAAGEYLAMGMHSLTLADTTGMGHPQQVADFCRAVRNAFPGVPVTAHFHNTRGMGLANVLAAVDAGVDSIDASLGGIGGCPYAPGATGNICTEDTVHMLEACGIDTGVDLDALLDLSRELPDLLGHPVPGQVLQAGKRTQRQACPEAA